MFPGRDIAAREDEKLHHHGSSTVKYGRGSVLTIDLTNRCNMMSSMFHGREPGGFRPRTAVGRNQDHARQRDHHQAASADEVQFSGGEPTLSPYFLDAVRYARKVGYNSCRLRPTELNSRRASNSVSRQLKRVCVMVLSVRRIGNAANAHRMVGNLFDVKLKAIENLHKAGVEIVPVVTIVNGIGTEQVGRIIKFALDNPKTISFLSFQPVSFTGRDEAVTDDRRNAQRYTLSHLAHDVKNQTGLGEPSRDWFPIASWELSATGPT